MSSFFFSIPILLGIVFLANAGYDSCHKPSVVQSGHEISSFYSAENVLRSVSCIQTSKRIAANTENKYYATLPGAQNFSFIIDIGCLQLLSQVTLRNAAHNYGLDPVGGGTKDFKIEISKDLDSWKDVVKGKLKDVRDIGCFAPYEKFDFKQYELTRFIKFTGLSHHGNEGALEYLTWKVVNCFENTNQKCEKPKYESPNAFGKAGVSFQPANLAKDECENITGHAIGTAYIPKDGEQTNVIIDIGCEQEISAIKLRNTHNGVQNDRGTKMFRAEISTDKKKWTLAVRTSLVNPLKKGCLVPLETFYFIPIKGRYIRILGESSYHRMGGGLQHVSWVATSGQRYL